MNQSFIFPVRTASRAVDIPARYAYAIRNTRIAPVRGICGARSATLVQTMCIVSFSC